MNNGKVVSLDAQRQVILWEPAVVVLPGIPKTRQGRGYLSVVGAP